MNNFDKLKKLKEALKKLKKIDKNLKGHQNKSDVKSASLNTDVKYFKMLVQALPDEYVSNETKNEVSNLALYIRQDNQNIFPSSPCLNAINHNDQPFQAWLESYIGRINQLEQDVDGLDSEQRNTSMLLKDLDNKLNMFADIAKSIENIDKLKHNDDPRYREEEDKLIKKIKESTSDDA